jgi:hypothetical protein
MFLLATLTIQGKSIRRFNHGKMRHDFPHIDGGTRVIKCLIARILRGRRQAIPDFVT